MAYVPTRLESIEPHTVRRQVNDAEIARQVPARRAAAVLCGVAAVLCGGAACCCGVAAGCTVLQAAEIARQAVASENARDMERLTARCVQHEAVLSLLAALPSHPSGRARRHACVNVSACVCRNGISASRRWSARTLFSERERSQRMNPAPWVAVMALRHIRHPLPVAKQCVMLQRSRTCCNAVRHVATPQSRLQCS
jgi:hypothetical protein